MNPRDIAGERKKKKKNQKKKPHTHTKNHCPPACKQQAYTSLVRPLLEYGAVVWGPYLKKSIDSMEKTQRIAARFITGDFRSNTPGSVTRLLERTGLPPLQLRRQHLRLTLFYRVVDGLVPALPPHQFLTPQKQGRLIRTVRKDDFQVTNIIRGHVRHNTRAYVVPQCATEERKNSFFCAYNSWLESVRQRHRLQQEHRDIQKQVGD